METRRVGWSSGGCQTPSSASCLGLAHPPGRVFPAPRPRLPAPAAHSGAPSPLPRCAVTSAAGAGVRLRAAPHPSARALERCLPSASSGPPWGRGGGWGGSGRQRPLAPGLLPSASRRFPWDSDPDTAAPRASARDWPGLGGETTGGSGRGSGAVAWQPRHAPRHASASLRVTQGAGPTPLLRAGRRPRELGGKPGYPSGELGAGAALGEQESSRLPIWEIAIRPWFLPRK